MKKILILSLTLLAAAPAFSQRYMTRTGRVSFFSTTPIENIEAINDQTSCIMNAATGDVAFKVPIKSFKFEKALMGEHFNENYMESTKYPTSDFAGKITNMSAVNLKKDGVYNVNVAGKLQMHNVTRDISVPGTVTVKGGNVIAFTKFNVKPSDYGIKIPSMAAGKIANSIEVTVNSEMKPTGR
jgi:polyisoprenoid-binding protein YceI